MNPPPAVYVYDPPTVMKGRRYKLEPNTELVFKGGNPPRHRRQIVVTGYGAVQPSTSVNVAIQIRTNTSGVSTFATELEDGIAIALWGKSSISLFTNADIVIRNGNDGLAVSVTVCEIFYA